MSSRRAYVVFSPFILGPLINMNTFISSLDSPPCDAFNVLYGMSYGSQKSHPSDAFTTRSPQFSDLNRLNTWTIASGYLLSNVIFSASSSVSQSDLILYSSGSSPLITLYLYLLL